MPDYEITHYNMGLALMRQGKMKESESYFRNAITFDHGFAKAYNYLGYVLAKQDRRREAKRCFETAIERDPDDQIPRENLSLLLSGSL
jgi:tetratricopeptide (TPR) repeat protein